MKSNYSDLRLSQHARLLGIQLLQMVDDELLVFLKDRTRGSNRSTCFRACSMLCAYVFSLEQ
jgi:hypothetical protein